MLLGLTLAPTLTIGPAALSYPDLAKALTDAGMPCAAAPNLAERGAYVRLQGRSPEAVRSVLKEALGVAFVPVERGWRMVVDPETKERDRLLLVAYRRQMVEAARAWAKEEEEIRRGRSYTSLKAWSDAQKAEIQPLAENDPRLPDLVSKALNAYGSLNLASWFGAKAARNSTIVGNTLERRQDWVVGSEEAARSLGFPLAHLSSNGVPSAVGLKMSLDYDLLSGGLSVNPNPIDSDGNTVIAGWGWRVEGKGWNVAGHTGIPVQIPIEGRTLEETFVRMGPSAQTYLAKFASTDKLPERPVGKGPSPLYLSCLLERLDVESVMELSPVFENSTTGRSSERFSLRMALSVPQLSDDGSPKPLKWFGRISALSRMNQPRLERRYPWRAAAQDGIWIVANPFGFLDRLKPVSPVPYVTLERLLRELPKDAPPAVAANGEPLPDWKLLTEIARATPPGGLSGYGYRGVASAAFVNLLPVVRAVNDYVPGTQRIELWKAALDPKGVRWETPHGVLTLLRQAVGGPSDTPPVSYVLAYWQDEKGSSVLGDGFLDARGL